MPKSAPAAPAPRWPYQTIAAELRDDIPSGRLKPSAWHHVERHVNNPIEAHHGRLKHRLRAMRARL